MTDNAPLSADPNLRRTVNQMLDFFTEPDEGEKYLKDLEDDIVELVKKHELQAVRDYILSLGWQETDNKYVAEVLSDCDELAKELENL